MRERRNTAAVANSLDAFLERWLVAIYGGLRVVRQVDVECLLESRYVSFIEQDLRDVGPPDLIASVDFGVLEPNRNTQPVQLRHQVDVPLTAARLLRLEPCAKLRGRAA